MKDNAWRSITSNDYDAHMSHPKVEQTQMLNRIFKEQFELLPQEYRSNSCVAILGITNGNGLEHVISCKIAKVIGIDINEAFLNECKSRYHDIQSRLNLFLLDLMIDTNESIEILSECDLIIANLLIKHIHLDNFIKIMAGLPKHGQIVSCVIQINPDGVVVSQGSGFEHVFDIIVDQREEENEDLIVTSMDKNGFSGFNRVIYDLPNGKQFIRLDFISK
ncbi:MAG: class I SAM-dependent methyltransferase [Oscillospiraceae bacterium]|nr:class I SAM-dependent methyltransferase [Oscillospiraceae bacterium]